MKKILVTGSNGQLGNEIKKLSAKHQGFEFIYTDVNELDITDANKCEIFIKNIKPYFVINCAAYTAVDKAETDKEFANTLNAVAVKNIVAACAQTDTYLIQVSTDYVFDGKTYLPYKETDKTSPQSEYGISKLAGETEALKYEKALVIRTSWLYSTFGNNFVKTMIKLGSDRDSLNVIFDQIGTPTYAEDLAAAILHVINKINLDSTKFIKGIYHYSNEGVCSWYDFACAIMKLKELKCNIYPIETKDYPTPAKRPYYSVLNKTKIKLDYNVETNHWASSLEKMIKSLDKE